jgi:hypothetical protein
MNMKINEVVVMYLHTKVQELEHVANVQVRSECTVVYRVYIVV